MLRPDAQFLLQVSSVDGIWIEGEIENYKFTALVGVILLYPTQSDIY